MPAARLAGLALLALAGCAAPTDEVALSRGQPNAQSSEASAGKPAKPVGGVKLALDELDAKAKPKLTVTSAAFKNGEPIPATYSDYGEKASPPLRIEGVPAGAKSLMVVCDDPDAKDPKPYVHWVIYNLPADQTELRTAVPGTGQVRQLMNAKQGPNSSGSTGYFGPRPPVNDPPHHYHFQVFALDQMLPLEQGAKKGEVIAAAKGHVVAAGELVGTFQKVVKE